MSGFVVPNGLRVGRPVTEEARRGGASEGVRVPLWEHPEWARRLPWLVQGTTASGSPGDAPGAVPFDLALFGDGRAREVMERWWALGRATGMARLATGHQVHEAVVRMQEGGPAGLFVAPATDGHATRAPGVLLAVSVADCVPVSVVAPDARAVALLHAGWRGAAAGILEVGLALLAERFAIRADAMEVHLGPAICGRCYEVGPEVHAALGLPTPPGPSPLDLRAALAERARRAGVPASAITVSTWCTRCGDSPFFSHRGGCRERQVGVLGIAEG